MRNCSKNTLINHIREPFISRPSHAQHGVDFPNDDSQLIDHLPEYLVPLIDTLCQLTIFLKRLLVLLRINWLRAIFYLIFKWNETLNVGQLHALSSVIALVVQQSQPF